MKGEREKIVIRKCPICGRKFIPATYHIYKSRGRLVCTWSCVVKGEGKQEKKELEYEAITPYNEKSQTKRYAIHAKRLEADEWSGWTEVDDLDKALYHLNKCKELGYIAKMIERDSE